MKAEFGMEGRRNPREIAARRRTHEGFGRDRLRDRWLDLRRRAVLEVRFSERDAADELQDLLRGRLGPLLQQLERELARYPDHDRARVATLGRRVERVVAAHRRRASAILGDLAPASAAWLDTEVAGFLTEVRRRVEWYDRAGPAADG